MILFEREISWTYFEDNYIFKYARFLQVTFVLIDFRTLCLHIEQFSEQIVHNTVNNSIWVLANADVGWCIKTHLYATMQFSRNLSKATKAATTSTLSNIHHRHNRYQQLAGRQSGRTTHRIASYRTYLMSILAFRTCCFLEWQDFLFVNVFV